MLTLEKTNLEIRCDNCEEMMQDASHVALTVRGDNYCADCTSECEDCGKNQLSDQMESVYIGDKIVCNDCLGNYYHCTHCGNDFHVDDGEWDDEQECCVSCSSDSFPHRSWERNKTLEVYKRGKFMQSNRLFGIEIEAEYASTKDVVKVSEKIHEDIGIAEDAGAEFQTPPSCGEEAEKMIRKLSYYLRKYKFNPKDGCGYHLHVDAADLDAKSLKNLYLLYIVFDDVIRSLINPFRRTSHWCNPTKDVFNKVMECETQADLERVYYGLHSQMNLTDDYLRTLKRDRKAIVRNGFNLQCVFAEKHLEIRYHESTTSGKRMLEWANLHCLMMDLAKKGFDYGWIRRAHRWKIGKMNKLFKTIGLSGSSKHYWKQVKKSY